MKSSLRIAAALLLWMPLAPAQSAVLIGMRLAAWDDNTGSHPPSYRTFLITFRDGKAQLAAEVPDLIVPRKDGFWRVGALHKGPACCGGDQEFIYAAPVRSVPHAAGDYDPEPVVENPDSSCSPTSEVTIEFVSSDLLSASYRSSPGCSLEVDFGHGTFKLDDLARNLEIAATLGPAAWEAEKKADARAKSEHAFSDLSNCAIVSKVDPTNWGVVRYRRLPQGATTPWVLVGDYTTLHVCGDGDRYPIEFPVPASLAGLTYHADILGSLLKSKAAVENRIPPTGAFLTPAGDFLVTFEGVLSNGEAVRIFKVRQQTIEPKPALSVFTDTTLSGEFDLVMMQWAVGKHVAEWESELQGLQKTRLPEPTLATGATQHQDP